MRCRTANAAAHKLRCEKDRHCQPGQTEQSVFLWRPEQHAHIHLCGGTGLSKKDAFAWAHKLKDAGVDEKMVVYNGMGQGYLNATGVFL